jgi:hypothetical protein
VSRFCNTGKVQRVLGIVERLRLRREKRLTVNAIRNQPAMSLADQQRNRITQDETNIASPHIMEYDFSQLVSLRRSFASVFCINRVSPILGIPRFQGVLMFALLNLYRGCAHGI